MIPFAWTLWGVLLVTLLVSTAVRPRKSQRSPEVGDRLGFLVIASLYLLLAVAGVSLYGFTQGGSRGGLFTVLALLGYFVIMLVAQPLTKAYKHWRLARTHARIGRFKQPDLRPLAEAIQTEDGASLRRLLLGNPPPPGQDDAGHDLLGYALVAVRDRNGSPDCVRALLEAGCHPDTAQLPDGLAPIPFMIVDVSPRGRETVSLLLQHGANPNAVDPLTGNSPLRESGDSPDLVRALVAAGADIDRVQPDGVTALVNFVAGFHWESARYLVEQGARLDVANQEGLSLDYYLESWKDSVFGERPDGWDRLRAAIAGRGMGQREPR